jgi:hypothetical protein
VERYNPIRRVDVAKDVTRDFIDEVGIWQFWAQQSYITLQLGANCIEALDLEVQKGGTLDKLGTGVEPMTAVACMMGEIGRRQQTGKQHCSLPEAHPKLVRAGPISPLMEGWTRHDAGSLSKLTNGRQCQDTAGDLSARKTPFG